MPPATSTMFAGGELVAAASRPSGGRIWNDRVLLTGPHADRAGAGLIASRSIALSLTSRSKQMTKRLSEQLADLSAHAKSAEEALDAADKKAHDKVVALKQQAHEAA